LIFDRAYLDYAWLYQLHQGTVWFVTRLKSNSCYEVIQEQPVSGPVLGDQSIRLSSPKGQACYPEPLRRVHYRDPETDKEYVFLTNRLDLSALEVAELYRRRWQVGVSSQGRIIQSVQVRPRLKDSRPRSWEGAVARKQGGKALRQPFSQGGGATLQVVTCSERRRSLVTRIPVAETVYNVRRQHTKRGSIRSKAYPSNPEEFIFFQH
jgi:hypothetical protein